MIDATRWLRCFRPTAGTPVLRLVCCAHAGGGPSAFRTWHEHLPAGVEVLAVRYPGRQDRFADEPLASVERTAEEITAAVLTLRDAPVALFGHSMGSWVAYEVARRCEAVGVPLRALLVSGQPSPLHGTRAAFHLLDDDGLVAELRKLDGDGDHLFDDPELRELLLPAVRADFAASAAYRPQANRPVRCPVRAYAGRADAEAPEPELLSWKELAAGGFSHRILDGGHFYLVDQEAELLADIAAALLGPAPAITAR